MPTTINLRKILDRKQWEPMSPSPVTSGTGSFTISSTLTNRQLLIQNAATHYLLDPNEDATIQLPASGIAGTFGAGSCGCHHPSGPTGTAVSGSTATTLATALNLPGNLGGQRFTVRLTGGTGAGQDRVFTSNTLGPNSTLTVDTPWTVTPDTTTTFLLLTGRYWFFNAGTASTFGLRYYDSATNTWSAALNAAFGGAAWGTEGRLVAAGAGDAVFATGTATGGSTTTLVNSAKAWATNQFANMQVRFTGGTNAGQIRTIASNTGTTLTLSSALPVAVDTTSAYAIEQVDDYLYLLGNAAVTLYRYSISGNSWTTLAPTTARAAAPGAGMSGHIVSASVDSTWTQENAIVNGRRLYSFRGGATSALDYYDIPSNTWVSNLVYLRQNEVFGTGTGYTTVDGDKLYIQKDNTGRFFRFDYARQRIDPWSTLVYPQGGVVNGDRVFDIAYTDGGSTLRWICMWTNSQNLIFRCLII